MNMEIRTVGDCFYQIRNGANIKQGSVSGGYPITRIETTANDKFNRDRMGYAGITDLSKYESYVLEDGDLLMSHINSVQYLGRTVLYEKAEGETVIHGMNLLGLKANRGIINPAYARYFFYSPYFREQLGRITKKSVNQASFTVADLKKIRIITPSLDQQTEMVDSLDRVKNLISKRNDELNMLDELIKARFVEMFGDPVSNPKQWKKELLGANATLLNGRAYKQDELLDSGKYPVLRVGNFFSNRGWYYSDLELDEDKYCDNGDLLYAWSASFGPRIWNGGKVIYHYHIWKVLVGDAYNKNFLCRLLDYATESLMGDTHGIAMMHLTKSGMEQTEFIVPPIELQEEFANFAVQVDKSKKAVQKALDETQTLFDSLMQKYFG